MSTAERFTIRISDWKMTERRRLTASTLHNAEFPTINKNHNGNEFYHYLLQLDWQLCFNAM